MSIEQRKHEAPPRYDEAFKAGAVRMVTEQWRPSREVAAELTCFAPVFQNQGLQVLRQTFAARSRCAKSKIIFLHRADERHGSNSHRQPCQAARAQRLAEANG